MWFKSTKLPSLTFAAFSLPIPFVYLTPPQQKHYSQKRKSSGGGGNASHTIKFVPKKKKKGLNLTG